MINVDKLLKKRKWTGAELGRLRVADVIVAYDKALNGGDYKGEGLISKTDFRKMSRSIINPIDMKEYMNYMRIADWISTSLPMAIAHEQQAQLHARTFTNVLANIGTAEDIYNYIADLPLIMTEKEYNDFTKKRTEEILNSEELRNYDVMRLINHAIAYYVNLLENKPRSRNPLKKLKKILEKQQVEDNHILGKYNEVCGNGYYTTEEGYRSDEMQHHEWIELINPLYAKYLEAIETNEEEAQKIKKLIVEKREFTDAKLMILNNCSLEEARELRHEEEIKEGFTKKITWHYYKDIPKDLNKWEIIKEVDFIEYYPYLDDGLSKEESISIIKAFCEEFKDLVPVIIDDITKKYPELEYIKTTPIEDWLSTTIDAKKLHELNFYDFKEIYTGFRGIFDGNHRALLNGISILKDDGLRTCINKETNYYEPPEIIQSYTDISLEGLFLDDENYASNLEAIEDTRETLTESMYFLKAFNESLELISTLFEIEEVKLLKRNIKIFEEMITEINETISYLYLRIYLTYYDDKELKQKKLNVFRDVLYFIDTEKMIVPKDRIERTKEYMKDFSAFNSDEYNPVYTLCLYTPDSKKEG